LFEIRILLVTHQFFPRFYTGVERLTLNLATQLGRLGHECTVLTSASHSSGDSQPYIVDTVHVRPLEAVDANFTRRPWLGGGATLQQVLRENRPDLVHVMHPMRFPKVFAEACRSGIPLIAHVPDFFYPCARITMVQRDGSLCSSPEEGDRCISACGIALAHQRLTWAREALGSADAVVSPCRATIELHRQSGFDTSRWHHVPWGVDYTLHPARLEPPPPGPLRLGFLGTLVEHKGARVAVEAVCSRPGLHVELRLYGESFHERDYEHGLRRMAGSDSRVIFAGAYEHSELHRILAELDAVVLPSIWHENLPTAGLNAIAAGVPLLVSDVGGLVELVDDYDCGLTFHRGDAEDLANLLERLVREPETLPGIRARMSHPLSVEGEARSIEGLYNAVRADVAPELPCEDRGAMAQDSPEESLPGPAAVPLRDEIVRRIWKGDDPFASIDAESAALDLQGWNSQHAFLREAITNRPRVVVEVGVWKGASVIFMASLLREMAADGVVIAVDTYLGSWEHWLNLEWRAALELDAGYPTLFRTFQRNVVAAGVADYVVPLPLDSANAASLLDRTRISADVIHIDAAHDYGSVLADLKAWWPRLLPGGVLIADDYDEDGKYWPSVKKAVDEFVRSYSDVIAFESHMLKARATKAHA
jgi:glycosyltransferase involved in cell wall biosynthesis/predicted O-methyltransferase YrrM